MRRLSRDGRCRRMGDRRFQTSLLFSPLRKSLLFTMAMLVIVAMLYILAMVTALRMPAHQENRVAQFENLLAQVLRKAGWECPSRLRKRVAGLQATHEALWQ